jgi:hypothetical protein
LIARRNRRGERAAGADAVGEALQKYADRGVFRGLKATRRAGGRSEYSFRWLTPRALTLTYDPRQRVLAFRRLFPHVGARSPIASALREVVATRSTRRVPAHKRLDPRKVQAGCAVRQGSFALTLRIVNGDEPAALSQLLNLVNELFLVLHEAYPEYLVAHFGLSAE